MMITLLTLYRCGSAAIGKRGGPQTISITPSCTGLNLAHEIFHALGHWHEHRRPDHNNFVGINWKNVKPGIDHIHVYICNYSGTPLFRTSEMRIPRFNGCFAPVRSAHSDKQW